MTFQPAASCQVLYGTNTRLILLPAIPPPDSYAFLKQQLCDSFAELEKGDIEVFAVGASLPGPWPAKCPLRKGTYRVQLKPDSSSGTEGMAKLVSLLTVSLEQLDRSGYFTAEVLLPDMLELTVSQEMLPGCQQLLRKRSYHAEPRMLEYAFYAYFKERGADLALIAYQRVGVGKGQAQVELIQALSERKLMLRITDFASGKDLLLRPEGSEMFAYMEDSGIVERLAVIEAERFIEDQRLVMVVDLDQTLVHTAETEEEKLQLQTGQHPLNLQSNLLDLSPHDHTPGKDLSNLLCIPRASLVGFFRAIRFRYTVFYLTAGTQEYGNAVVEAMREFLLKDNSLDDRDRCWINEAVTRRGVLSCSYARGQRARRHLGISEPRELESFKSLGMLLKMAYLPEYVARLVFILDDTLQVWKVPSDRLLVHPICKQQFQTSHAKPNRQQELTKYASLARKLWEKACAGCEMNRGKTLCELETEVAQEFYNNYLYNSCTSQQ